MYGEDGNVREHWNYLLDSLQSLGPEAIRDRHKKAQRILRDDGATYNDYSDAASSKRWELDPIPLLLDSDEWSQIESALLQRADLLNLVLKDIYGPRDLIKYGVLPPEVLFSHPGFLRACHGVTLPGDHQLITYAADIIQTKDGDMRVICDRTQAPSGAGYSLENRMVMSRVFPSLYRDSHVHRLAPFFQSLRRTLSHLSPGNELPRVVVLTPGSRNETYFEHAYLATYLGYPLVQGQDLTVRDGYVWMKALNGLQRVDVILRRQDDYFCDPVELKGDSQLGVPGLLDVARSGNVAIANPLGSGALENPALMKYLPKISEHFFGHELRAKSVDCWWCGDTDDRDYVLKNIDKLVIKPTFRHPGLRTVFGPELTPDERDIVRKKINDNPARFTAQVIEVSSSAPAWDRQQLVPRPTVLRSFAVVSDSSYLVLPGGLTRVGGDEASLDISSRAGAVSKDTWVIASEPERIVSLWDDKVATDRLAQRADMPSRVMENLFWVGRHAERAEGALRLLRTVFIQLNGVRLPQQTHLMLLRAVTHLTATYPGFTANDQALMSDPEQELRSVIIDGQRPGSVASSLLAMLTSAEQVKEALSVDTQRIINDLRDNLSEMEEALDSGLTSAPEEALDPTVTSLLAFAGLAEESMVREFGWHFMQLGRRLERALQLASIMRAMLVPLVPESEEGSILESTLLSVETLNIYRRRYYGQMNLVGAFELLLMDRNNPRSLIFQLERVRKHLDALPGAETTTGLSRECQLILEATTNLQLANLQELATPEGDEGIRSRLDQLLSRTQRLVTETGIVTSDRFFDHTKGPQLLINSNWDHEL